MLGSRLARLPFNTLTRFGSRVQLSQVASQLRLRTALSRGFSNKPEDFIEGADDRAKTIAEQKSGRGQGEEAVNRDPMGGDDENSFYNEKKNAFYIFFGAGITLIGLYFVMIVNSASKTKKKGPKNTVTSVGRANIGGPWQLKTMEGKPFGSGDLEGKYYLIYFGFCRCPDVCPQSLYKLTKALEMIRNSPESKYFDLEMVFVTVDPDRDTKEDVEKFLKHFDKRIIAVTGANNNDPALRQMMARFKIHATKIEMESDGPEEPGQPKAYTLDHTIITYLMDDENHYVTHIGSNMSASETANHIITKVNFNQKEKYSK